MIASGPVVRSSAVAAAALVAACLQPGGATCEDGTLCGGDRVCAPAGGCVEPEQLAACELLSPGDRCELAIGVGVCVDGVCELGRCGNQEVDPGEACDDGNTASGDGCRADCGKVEACGDGVVDASEACDDGNANTVDGCDACLLTAWQPRALLAGAVPALEVVLDAPTGLAADRRGNLYVSDHGNNRVLRVDHASGVVTVVAGTGEFGTGGDGGPGSAAALTQPRGVAVDGLGNVILVDSTDARVRRVDGLSGDISTIAGGADAATQLVAPDGLAIDGAGDVLIADPGRHQLLRISSNGAIAVAAGTGADVDGGDGLTGPATALRAPTGVAIAANGDIFFTDRDAGKLRRIDRATGVVSTIAAIAGATALAIGPTDEVAVTTTGNQLHLVDPTTGTVTLLAGTGAFGDGLVDGDGGPALRAALAVPAGVAFDAAGDVFVTTYPRRVRQITRADGMIHGAVGSTTVLRDGFGASSTRLPGASGLAIAADGALLIGSRARVERVEPSTGSLVRVAGIGVDGFGGDGGGAVSAQLAQATDLATRDGAVWLVDQRNRRVRRIFGATIDTVAGNGEDGDDGDGAAATAARFHGPDAVAVAPDGTVYVADRAAHRVRRIDVAGVIHAFAGTGVEGSDGVDGPAVDAQLRAPSDVAVDATGRVLIVDQDGHALLRVELDGTLRRLAGDGTEGLAVDGQPPAQARLNRPHSVVVDGDDLYLSDAGNGRIWRIDLIADQIVTYAGGNPDPSAAGDGGPRLQAHLFDPFALALDDDGDLYLLEPDLERVRVIERASGRALGVAGPFAPEGTGSRTFARLATPLAMARAGGATWFGGGTAGVVQRLGDEDAPLETVVGRYPQGLPTADLARFRGQAFGEIGGVAFDAATATLYLTETSAHRLHAVEVTDLDDPTTWVIRELGAPTAAGGFVDGALGDARFRAPRGLWFDDVSRTLLVADTGNHVVRAIDVDAELATTIAGTPATLGYFGDGLAATDALLYAPRAVALAPGGDLYIADTGNHRVRRVAAEGGVITTVLGDGVAASSGDGAPARDFPVDAPAGLAFDADGNLYATSSATVRVLPARADGVVDGDGPVLTIYGAPPRDTFPALATTCLTGVVAIDDTTVQVTDACTGLLVELRRRPAL